MSQALTAVGFVVGFSLGGAFAGVMVRDDNNPLSTSVREAANEFYEIAARKKMVPPEELLAACVDGVNKRSELAVRAWLSEESSPKSPADGPQ